PAIHSLSLHDALPISTGSMLFSISRDLVANPKMLYRALGNSGSTTWVSTPSFAQMCLVEEKFAERMLPRIRRFLFCGETLAAQTDRKSTRLNSSHLGI